MENRPLRIAVIGAGNVASHLAPALRSAGCEIVSVSSLSGSSHGLAKRLNCREVAVKNISPDVDAVLIAVKDSAVATVAAELPPADYLVMHTSGSIPLETLSSIHRRAAVFYPLQTFSRDVPVNIREVPFFTEASDGDCLATVDAIARRITDCVYHADSSQRRHLHLAGVLSSNFPIYLLELAGKTLAEAGFPLEVVKPLVKATVDKAFAVGPHDALTGPARRGDIGVVNSQASMLAGDEKDIYLKISKAIIKEYHSEQN